MNVPNYIGGGTKNIATAGTQVPLSTTSIPSYEVVLTSDDANAGEVYFGGPDVDNTYPPLNPGDSATVPTNDVSKVWVDAANNNEDVRFTYTAPGNPTVQSPLYGG